MKLKLGLAALAAGGFLLLGANAQAGDYYRRYRHAGYGGDALGLRAPLSEVAHAVTWPLTTVERNGVIGGAVRIVTGPEMRVGSPSDGMTAFHADAQARNAAEANAELAAHRTPMRLDAGEQCAYGVCW